MVSSIADLGVPLRLYPEAMEFPPPGSYQDWRKGYITCVRLLMDARLAHGYSREELAERTGIGLPHLTRVEMGSDRVSVAEAIALSAALQLPLDVVEPLLG